MLRHHALATARSGATSAIIIVVLTATLLTLVHFESTAAHAKAPAPAASTGGDGSGTLGSWLANTKVISSGAHVRHVVATNGVILFGDSIAVQDGEALGRLLAQHLGTSFAEHSWSGQPTSAAVDAMAAWASAYGLPHRIVMATGTNDIFNPAAFTAQVDRAMRIAGPDRTVYWVNVQVSRTDEPTSVQVADQPTASGSTSSWHRHRRATRTCGSCHGPSSWPHVPSGCGPTCGTAGTPPSRPARTPGMP